MSESSGLSDGPTHFPVLDSMRAVGAIAVLTTHAAFWSGSYTGKGVLGTLLSRLDVGVAIFFVLSGFLLARPYLGRAAVAMCPPGTGRYFWKRTLRIMPVYVLTVVLALSLIDANADLGLTDWVTTLLLADLFVGTSFPDGLTHMWSLAVEVSFYLLLPLVMLAATGRQRLRPRRVLLALGALVAVSVWWHTDGAAVIGGHTSGAPLQWLPAYLSWFAVGILFALTHLLHVRGSLNRAVSALVSLAQQPGSCWAVVGALMLVAATPLAGPSLLAAPTDAQSLTKHVLYAFVGGLVVLTGVFPVSGSRYERFFAHPVPRRLGWVSYGIFSLHLPILHAIIWTTEWPLFQGGLVRLWALTLVLSVVAAELSYRLLERPAMRLRGLRLSRRRRSPTNRAASGTSTR